VKPTLRVAFQKVQLQPIELREEPNFGPLIIVIGMSPPRQTGLERLNIEGRNNKGSENGDKSASDMELGVVTKVYHGV
jgi:hypothetical protein